MMRIIMMTVALLFTIYSRGQIDDSPREIRRETTVEHLGDIGQFVPAAASAALVLINKDEEGAWQFLKGMSANLALTYTLKYALNKPRPEGATDGKALPSGHTSFAFQGASFVQRRYGWKYGIPAYALASFVGYSRIEGIGERHDGWDVLAGALVGIGSAYLFTTPYAKEHFELNFTQLDNYSLVGITYKF